MGGGSYSRRVNTSSSSKGYGSGATSSHAAKVNMGRATADSSTNAKRVTKSLRKNPVCVNIDGTGSNVEAARIVYDKAPMFHGQIEQQGYLKDHDIAYSICGDAYCDSSPLQIADPAYGDECETELKKLFLEGGGGGQQTETYELAAYYYARKFEMPNAETPFMFFFADEAPYPVVGKNIVRSYCGDTIDEDIPTQAMFKELDKKFNNNVFVILNPYCGGDPNDTHSKLIKQVWQKFLPAERVIDVKSDGEKGLIDIILGAIAVVSNSRDLESYLKDMEDRGQDSERINQVKDSLTPLTNALVPVAHGDGSLSIFDANDLNNDIQRF